ncbi:MAG: CobD/CbiB family protein [Thauera sp.]|jgi:adenosylcobinamide-phosphate synthase|nr:CobD/CbiB family protein [Thauera sp.]
MGLITLILALLADQLRPHEFLSSREQRPHVEDGMAAVSGAERWLAVVLGAGFASALAFYLLWELNSLFALLFNIAVLYLMLGFRGKIERFSRIHLALRMGEIDHARQLLADWYGFSGSRAGVSEIARLSIEKLLLSAHRHVFGVVFWFLILPGPSGAVMYRLACMLAERARARQQGGFAVRVFELIDWLPVRLSAFVCAVVGNFEDALYCWRTQAARWPEASAGVLLASAAGALGLRLGMQAQDGERVLERPELGAGGDADVEQMQNTINLLWRALLVCLFLIALLSLVG